MNKKDTETTRLSPLASIDLLDCAVPDELNYSTNYKNDISIMREINRLRFAENNQPLINATIEILKACDVDFSTLNEKKLKEFCKKD